MNTDIKPIISESAAYQDLINEMTIDYLKSFNCNRRGKNKSLKETAEKYYLKQLIEAMPKFAAWMVDQKGTSIKLPISVQDGNFTLTLARNQK